MHQVLKLQVFKHILKFNKHFHHKLSSILVFATIFSYFHDLQFRPLKQKTWFFSYRSTSNWSINNTKPYWNKSIKCCRTQQKNLKISFRESPKINFMLEKNSKWPTTLCESTGYLLAEHNLNRRRSKSLHLAEKKSYVYQNQITIFMLFYVGIIMFFW